jgi:hypothetical protein
MIKPRKIALLLLCLVAMIAIAFGLAGYLSNQVHHREKQAQFLHRYFAKIQRQGGKALLVPRQPRRGHLSTTDGEPLHRPMLVSPGTQLLSKDHHGRATYTIQEFKTEGIAIRYEVRGVTRRGHSIHIGGTVQLPWK